MLDRSPIRFVSALVLALTLAACGPSAPPPPDATTQQIVVSVKADGSVTLDGKPVTLAQLEERLTTEVSSKSLPVVRVVPEPGTDYAVIAPVYATAIRSGLTADRVKIVTPS